MRFYVRIDGVSDDDLAFLGFTLLADSPDFKLYRNYYGEEFVVEKASPFLYVDDVNDFEILRSKSANPEIVQPPAE